MTSNEDLVLYREKLTHLAKYRDNAIPLEYWECTEIAKALSELLEYRMAWFADQVVTRLEVRRNEG